MYATEAAGLTRRGGAVSQADNRWTSARTNDERTRTMKASKSPTPSQPGRALSPRPIPQPPDGFEKARRSVEHPRSSSTLSTDQSLRAILTGMELARESGARSNNLGQKIRNVRRELRKMQGL